MIYFPTQQPKLSSPQGSGAAHAAGVQGGFPGSQSCSEFIENTAAPDFIFLWQKEGTKPPVVPHTADLGLHPGGPQTPVTPTLLCCGTAIPGEHLREGRCWQSNSTVIQISKFCPSQKCSVMIKAGFSHIILMNDSTGKSFCPQVCFPVSCIHQGGLGT